MVEEMGELLAELDPSLLEAVQEFARLAVVSRACPGGVAARSIFPLVEKAGLSCTAILDSR